MNDDIPEEIDDIIDDFEEFFRSKPFEPVNDEIVEFYEDDCVVFSSRRPHRKYNKFRPIEKKEDIQWLSSGSDDEEKKELDDFFGKEIQRPSKKT